MNKIYFVGLWITLFSCFNSLFVIYQDTLMLKNIKIIDKVKINKLFPFIMSFLMSSGITLMSMSI